MEEKVKRGAKFLQKQQLLHGYLLSCFRIFHPSCNDLCEERHWWGSLVVGGGGGVGLMVSLKTNSGGLGAKWSCEDEDRKNRLVQVR